MRILFAIALLAVPASASKGSNVSKAQEARKSDAAEKNEASKKEPNTKPLKPRKDGLIPVNKKQTVLFDPKKKVVFLETKICNRDAMLEMLICLPERKLHESILVLDAEAIHVHTALLAIGAKKGSPAKYNPKFVPAHGQPLDIFLNWKDKDGKQKRCRAQEWIRHAVRKYHVVSLDALPTTVKVKTKSALELRYDTRRKELLWFGAMTDADRKQLYSLSDDKKYRAAIDKLRESASIRPMKAGFLFAGSYFFEDDDIGRVYTAEGGFVACVANMPEALIDVETTSSASNANLVFETKTEVIPPELTPVTVELIPLPPRPGAGGHKSPTKTNAKEAKSNATKSPPDKQP